MNLRLKRPKLYFQFVEKWFQAEGQLRIKNKKNENLDEYSDDSNENTGEEDNSGLKKKTEEKAAISPGQL